MNKFEINFYPDSDRPAFLMATGEYQNIWSRDGERIIEAIEKISSLNFSERFVNSIVFEGISHSYPLSLRASYPEELKKSTLTHELCHRLLIGNGIVVKDNRKRILDLENHQILDLILYDVWSDLYGEDFAMKNVKVESNRQPFYKEAWEYALSFDRKTRTGNFTEIKKLYMVHINKGIH